ncbi:hypothetical protein JTE90_014320 [Oedothorax gibbosus]|uniref:Uncharacterized protein n=1 Tax=Oedothorax gibbosus TaxID=931172 RepID=A0AAV6UUR8_9ARAC|nr:hypothetical protein JTE90_014320 [Oedothorax gibbosus]
MKMLLTFFALVLLVANAYGHHGGDHDGSTENPPGPLFFGPGGFGGGPDGFRGGRGGGFGGGFGGGRFPFRPPPPPFGGRNKNLFPKCKEFFDAVHQILRDQGPPLECFGVSLAERDDCFYQRLLEARMQSTVEPTQNCTDQISEFLNAVGTTTTISTTDVSTTTDAATST